MTLTNLNRYYEGRNKRGLVVPDDGDILNSEVQHMSIRVTRLCRGVRLQPIMGEDDLRALVWAIINGEPEEASFLCHAMELMEDRRMSYESIAWRWDIPDAHYYGDVVLPNRCANRYCPTGRQGARPPCAWPL